MSDFVNNDVSPGAVVQASDHNTQGSLLAAVINGGIDNGNIATNAAIAGSKLADGSVTPAKLVSSSGTSWAWQDWTPTFGNLSGGTLNYAKFTQIGKTVKFRLKYTMAGANVGGAVTFSTPTTMAVGATTDAIDGYVFIVDADGSPYAGGIRRATTTTLDVRVFNSSGTYVVTSSLSSTVPITWASGDTLFVSGTYDMA